jgi:SAM-dependent methyltransferase
LPRPAFKRAFDHCTRDYAQYRPPYPPEAIRILAECVTHAIPSLVADVGAGTGIFSRQLARAGWHVAAVEPSEKMLQRVSDADAAAAPGAIHRICATAEAAALAQASMHAVTAAQAFHWFNPPFALAEFARILKPGGTLMLIWNNREATHSPFVEEYEKLIARYNTAYDREYRQQDWAGKIAASGEFEPARYYCLAHIWRLRQEDFVGFSRSVSYIRNVLSREQRPRFERDLRALIESHFGDRTCEVPLRADVWTARRRG